MKNKPSPNAENAQLHQLLLALTALRRHGPIAIVSSLLLAGAAAAAVVWFWEPVYEAKSFLRIKLNPEYTQILPDRNQGKTDVKSELAPIMSELVMRRVLLKEEVQKLPSFKGKDVKVSELRKMIKYQSAGGPELFEIVATSQHPREAQVLAKTVTDVFLDYFQMELTNRLGQLQNELKSEMESKSVEIQRVSKDLSAMVETMAGGSIRDSMFDPDGTYLAELRKSRIQLQIELQVLQQENEAFMKSIEEGVYEIDESRLKASVDANNQVTAARSSLRELEARRSELVIKRGSGHPDTEKVDEQILFAKRSLAELESQISQMVKGALVAEQKSFVSTKQAENDRAIGNLLSRLQYLDGEISKQVGTISKNNRDRTEYETLARDLARLEADYARLRDANETLRLKSLSVQYQIALQNETVELPQDPVERYPFKIIGIAALAGFGLPFALAFLWEFRTQRISHAQQLGKNMVTPLVGEVAALPTISNSTSKAVSRRVTKQLRLYQESVDNISTMLFVAKERIPAALAVTSAASNEGKTTLASQLALSLARSSQGRVLLIDCDLRSPSQHRLFDFDLAPGLAEVLEQNLSWRETVRQYRVENLDVLTAGRVKSSPRRCFSNHNWEELLKDVQQFYDYVIVDTPPVLATSEATIICKSCEATIMCTLRDVSRADSVQRAEERLYAAEVNVVGFVLGGVPQNEYANRYGSYGYNLSR